MRTLIAALLWFMVTAAGAQTTPGKPVRLLVGFPAGGPVDIVARLLGPRLAEALGQPVVIDNRGGANGTIAADMVAKAARDGHTLILSTPGAVTISPAVYPKLPFDTLRDLAPVVHVSNTPELLVVHPALPVRTVREMVTLARTRPGELNAASTGNASLPHLALELLKAASATQVTHVPYNGAAPAVAALMGGQVQAMFADLPVLLPHVTSGKLRALGVASARRAGLLPELATLAEQGYKVEAVNWYGILTTAKTPSDVLTRLHAAFAATLNDAALRERMLSRGAEPVGGSAASFEAYLRADMERWAQLARKITIQID